MFKNNGNSVELTVGIIPTFRVPPIIPFSSEITSFILDDSSTIFLACIRTLLPISVT